MGGDEGDGIGDIGGGEAVAFGGSPVMMFCLVDGGIGGRRRHGRWAAYESQKHSVAPPELGMVLPAGSP